jgi:hypothetical protein
VDNREADTPIPDSLADTPEAECVRLLDGRRRWLKLGMWGALGTVGGGLGYVMAPPTVVPLYTDGFYAYAHESHPPIVHQLVTAANELVGKPYKWGGGHQFLFDNGFDCSGSVSHVLYRVRLLDNPLSSVAFASYGWAGLGSYLTLFVNPGHHVFMQLCGLRFDTSGMVKGEGPRWRTASRSYNGFYARHPSGL